MADYITAITGLINMAAGLPYRKLLFILILGILWILAWRSPELINALRN